MRAKFADFVEFNEAKLTPAMEPSYDHCADDLSLSLPSVPYRPNLDGWPKSKADQGQHGHYRSTYPLLQKNPSAFLKSNTRSLHRFKICFIYFYFKNQF
jgi:hypothetical protein